MKPKLQHTPGQVRYLTYFLHFPKDKDQWVDQIPFVNHLDVFLQSTSFSKRPALVHALLKNGEASWKDHNGVTHQLIIEERARERNWGIKRPN